MERALLLRVSHGDEQAFTELYNTYQPLLSTHIFRITKSRATTDEIVQDVFMKIWLRRNELSTVYHFKAYIATISRNHALNELRRLSAEKLNHQQWQKENQVVVANSSDDNSVSDLHQLVDYAIHKLPPQQKKAYLLSRHQRLKYAEIAEKLHLTKGTVKRYLQLATETITKHLQTQAIKDAIKTVLIISLQF